MQESITTYNPLHDYRLILDPPLMVRKKIAAVKVAFDQDYKGMAISGGQAFVYLAEFSAPEQQEQVVTDELNRIALGFMPFKLHLSNFARLDEREIYIPIENEAAVQMLVKQIEQHGNLPPGGRVNQHPRITIAKGLKPFQFVKSWKKYEKKNFSATFIANKMLLLKRMEGFRGWQVSKHLEFQNLVMTP